MGDVLFGKIIWLHKTSHNALRTINLISYVADIASVQLVLAEQLSQGFLVRKRQHRYMR